jgi:hypothetical protein
MANAVYPKYKQAAMGGGANHDLLAGNVKAVLIDLADYTYGAAHEFLTSVPAGARVATSANLGTKTVTNGTFDAADTAFANVSGDVSEAVIIYVDTGVEGTSRLVAYLDTGVNGLPVIPNSGTINLQWDAAGIFTL